LGSVAYTFFVNDLLTPPLARWDGLHLAIDLDHVERLANEFLSSRQGLRDLSLKGIGDALTAEVSVIWKGVPARVGLEVAEIRLRHRYLGLRLRKIRALGGVPVPKAAVLLALQALDNPTLRIFHGDRIVVADLHEWLPEGLTLEVLTVQATRRRLHVWFGAGSLASLPDRGPRLLPASTESDRILNVLCRPI
jgi:hypothetical protein